jgi:hypothetical protein
LNPNCCRNASTKYSYFFFSEPFKSKLGFKIMIIIIFILTCLSCIILKLRVFYKDILEKKITNIFSRDMSSLYLLFWKYRHSLQNYPRDIFIFISLSLQPNIFMSSLSSSLLFQDSNQTLFNIHYLNYF